MNPFASVQFLSDGPESRVDASLKTLCPRLPAAKSRAGGGSNLSGAGAMSSILPAVDALLGIRNTSVELREAVKKFEDYVPKEHRCLAGLQAFRGKGHVRNPHAKKKSSRPVDASVFVGRCFLEKLRNARHSVKSFIETKRESIAAGHFAGTARLRSKKRREARGGMPQWGKVIKPLAFYNPNGRVFIHQKSTSLFLAGLGGPNHKAS